MTKARTRRTALACVPALLAALTTLLGACKTSKEIGDAVEYLRHDSCDSTGGCKKTCPQGDECWGYTIPGMKRGGHRGYCKCRGERSEPCSAASDCAGSWCAPMMFTCTHYPGSDVGSCECAADCETTRDCGPILGCDAGPECRLREWGDRGNCVCASNPKD
jgi:hypothetical protein